MPAYVSWLISHLSQVDSSRRAVKRIKLETGKLRSLSPAVESPSPTKSPDLFMRAESPFGTPVKSRLAAFESKADVGIDTHTLAAVGTDSV